jgi:hypothetical protein
MCYNISILTEDNTRPEMYCSTCSTNAKEFTCVHSLGLAMMRGTLNAPRAAQVQLLGRKRKRGRRPLAPPAWEMLPFRYQFSITAPTTRPCRTSWTITSTKSCGPLEAGVNLAEALLPEEVKNFEY